MKELVKVKNQIDNAIDLWNFDMVNSIYKNNFNKFDEIKMDYVVFLYETGQLKTLYGLIVVYDKIPQWWDTKRINEDFLALKNKINSIVQIDYKNINIGNHDFEEKDLLAYYLINCYHDENGLETEFVVFVFYNFVLKGRSLLTKAYIISKITNYFYSLQNYSFFIKVKHALLMLIENNFSQTKAYVTYMDIIHQMLKDYSVKIGKKRKIAVVIAGILRGDYEFHLKNIENKIIKPLNADVFLFTWDKVALWPGLCGGGANWISRMFGQISDYPVEIASQQDFKENFPYTYGKLSKEYFQKIQTSKLISCKNIMILKEEDFLKDLDSQQDIERKCFDFDNGGTEYEQKYVVNVLKNIYGLSKCCELVKNYEKNNNFTYDYIIKLRPDFDYSPFDIGYLDNLKDSEIAIRSNDGGLNDIGFYGKRQPMIKFLSFWENLDSFLEIFQRNGNSFHSAFYFWMVANQLKAVIPKSIGLATKQKMYLPNFKDELSNDFEKLKKREKITENKIQNFIIFFNKVDQYYDHIPQHILSDKRIALCLYGHLRTYQETYRKLFDNVVEPNQNDGYAIDIFIHTWNEWNSTKGAAGPRLTWYKSFNEKPVSHQDMVELLDKYKPVDCLIEHMEVNNGKYISLQKSLELATKHAKNMKIEYRYFIFTRPDIMFVNPFRLDYFLNFYKTDNVLNDLKLPKEHMFFGSNIFRRMPIADPRYINEYDLFSVSSAPITPKVSNGNSVLYIPINYKLHTDFFLWRETCKIENLEPLVEQKISLQKNIQTQNEGKQIGKDKIDNRQMQSLQIALDFMKKQLELQSKTMELQIKEFESVLHYGTAKSRIHNHLSYKLGKAMIENSKSILGYIRMPYVLSYIKEQHNKEQKQYQERIKNNPNLKLPQLESYPDYQEALEEKECLTYKLGEALMRADRTWYKGGYVKFCFNDLPKLKRKHKGK